MRFLGLKRTLFVTQALFTSAKLSLRISLFHLVNNQIESMFLQTFVRDAHQMPLMQVNLQQPTDLKRCTFTIITMFLVIDTVMLIIWMREFVFHQTNVEKIINRLEWMALRIIMKGWVEKTAIWISWLWFLIFTIRVS